MCTQWAYLPIIQNLTLSSSSLSSTSPPAQRINFHHSHFLLAFGSGGSSEKGFFCVSVHFKGKDGSGFGSWKTVLAVPVPLSVSGKTVPTVPVSGSGSVPEPPCFPTKIPPKSPNEVPKMNFPELPGPAFSVEILHAPNVPEFPDQPRFHHFGVPFSACWGGK